MREERKQEFNSDDSVDDAIELSEQYWETRAQEYKFRGTDNETYENLGEER